MIELLLAREVFMNKKQLVSTAAIATLLLTNSVWMYKYKEETKELEGQISKHKQANVELNEKYIGVTEEMSKTNGELEKIKIENTGYTNKITEYNVQIETLSKSNQAKDKSINSLKQQLETAKKRNRESP